MASISLRAHCNSTHQRTLHFYKVILHAAVDREERNQPTQPAVRLHDRQAVVAARPAAGDARYFVTQRSSAMRKPLRTRNILTDNRAMYQLTRHAFTVCRRRIPITQRLALASCPDRGFHSPTADASTRSSWPTIGAYRSARPTCHRVQLQRWQRDQTHRHCTGSRSLRLAEFERTLLVAARRPRSSSEQTSP